MVGHIGQSLATPTVPNVQLVPALVQLSEVHQQRPLTVEVHELSDAQPKHNRLIEIYCLKRNEMKWNETYLK